MGSDTPHLMGCYRTFDEGMKNLRSDVMAGLRNARSKSLEQYKESKKDAIYEVIHVYSIQGGISHKNLANISDLDRKSLRPYTKKLIEMNLIRKNSRRLYEVVEDSFKNPIETASAFGQVVGYKLLEGDKPIILNADSKHEVYTADQKRFAINDFTQYRKYFKPRFSIKEQVNESLFEFSNRIGSFITYLLIFSMNPATFSASIGAREKDEIIIKMVEKGISMITPTLLLRFKRFLQKYSQGNLQNSFSQIEFVEGSKFLLSEQSALKLIDAFTSIYPLMSYEFEKILPTRYKFKEVLNGWPSAVEGYKKSLDSFRELLKKQESCKHRYGKPTWTLYGFVGQQCDLCRHIRKVRKRHLKESKQEK